jgi:hypothetical protein
VDTDNVFAVLHYTGAPDADPKGKPKKLAMATVTTAVTDSADLVAAKGGIKLLEESDLHPLFNAEATGGSGPADRVIDLNFHHDSDNGEIEVSEKEGFKPKKERKKRKIPMYIPAQDRWADYKYFVVSIEGDMGKIRGTDCRRAR